jgi:hypothetical protein
MSFLHYGCATLWGGYQQAIELSNNHWRCGA